ETDCLGFVEQRLVALGRQDAVQRVHVDVDLALPENLVCGLELVDVHAGIGAATAGVGVDQLATGAVGDDGYRSRAGVAGVVAAGDALDDLVVHRAAHRHSAVTGVRRLRVDQHANPVFLVDEVAPAVRLRIHPTAVLRGRNE